MEDIFETLGNILRPENTAENNRVYKIEISFTSSRPLTALEMDSIVSAITVQVEEPFNFYTLTEIDAEISNIQTTRE
jgi:hypothetical protein